jgi:hypothetical protein
MNIEPLEWTLLDGDPRLRFIDGVHQDGLAVQRLLDAPTIRITGTVTEWRHQVLLLVLTDLLGRLFPRLDIGVDSTGPAAAGLPPGGETLAHRIAETRARSPLEPQPPGLATITVHVGVAAEGTDIGDADLFVDGSEWQSYLGTVPSRLAVARVDCAVGPFVAACRAAARIFDILLRIERSPLPRETYSSALTYRHGRDPLDDPHADPEGGIDTLLVGAGSVGGAAVLCLAFQPHVAGHLGVCDPQRLEARNPYRAILATADAATRNANKVDEVRARLGHHHGLDVAAHPMTITEWEAAHPAPPKLPLTLVAVDTHEDRERIQDALPVEVVNAAVAAHLIAISGHEFDSGACMCCLHMPEKLDSAAIKNRLIAAATSISADEVNRMRVRSQPVTANHICQIERFRRLRPGALSAYVGKTLDDLYDAELIYGEAKVTTDGGSNIAVAAPFATALAGALLAAETLKRSTPALVSHALGPSSLGIQYREDLRTPENGFIDPVFAIPVECICQSARRRRLTREMHQQSA